MENEGWKYTTYLYGMASYGFEYYVTHADGYEEGYLENGITKIDNRNLPLRFWHGGQIGVGRDGRTQLMPLSLWVIQLPFTEMPDTQGSWHIAVILVQHCVYNGE